MGLFLGGLVLRLVHLLTIRSSPFFLYLGLDPLAYHEWALEIAAGNWLGDHIFYQDPLYPYFLGLLYTLLGDHRLPVTAIQLLLGACIPPLIYDATRRALDQRAALLAGLMAAAYLPSIYYEGLILKTWLGAFLMALALWSMARALTSASTAVRWWLGTGVVLGLGCLVRGNLLLILPALAVWRLTAPWYEQPAGNETASTAGPLLQRLNYREAAALALGAVLILAPTAVRNRVVGGEWVLTTAQGGPNFYIGNNPINTTGRYATLPFVGANPKYERKGFTAEAQRRAGRTMRPTEISSYWYDQSFTWIRSHPGDWLVLTWKKFRAFWGAYEVPDNLDYGMYRRDAPILRLPLAGFGLITPLALAGAFFLWRRGGWPRALLITMAVYSASVVLFFVFSRYRLAMMPAMFPLAAYAVVEIMDRWRRRAPGRHGMVAALTLLALCFLFVHLPVHAHGSSLSYRMAAAVGLPRHAESSSAGHYNLGLAFAQYAEDGRNEQAMLEQAVAQFQLAIQEDATVSQPHAEMGKALARLGEDQRAITAYATVISMEPGKARPHHVLGILYRRTGDTEAAAGMYRRALQLDPRRVDSAVALGEVLLDLGRRGEAADAFRAALRIQPGHPGATAGLARAGGTP
jgi:tetratricopeptide (TPR) repeat protein